jgi:hypothetical protein
MLISIPDRRGYKEALRTLRFRCAMAWNISRNGRNVCPDKRRQKPTPNLSSIKGITKVPVLNAKVIRF